ncbi:Hypothetical predicted protein [Olea europaea subsp. europaea]|uniref:Uncharacterized protein n=1 Tax=Olea europaea subsp. europaea TaxID=158383 RepID=A0A8S0UEH9_OLEEU|nr:Hypothetical predicted protein [Olea europaea subsp. europaea]
MSFKNRGQDSFNLFPIGTETTLLKLKQGSLRNPSIAQENSTGTDVNCTMEIEDAKTMEVDFSSTNSLPISSSFESTDTSKEQGTKNLSVLYLFSRYNNSQQNSVSSPNGVDMLADSAFSSTSVSPSPGNGQLLST